MKSDLNILSSIGMKIFSEKTEIFPSKSDIETAGNITAELKAGGGVIAGFHPWTKRESRKWPEVNFILLGKKLVEAYGAKIILTPGPKEEKSAELIAGKIGKNVRILKNTDVRMLAALMKDMDIYVCGSTGPMHAAIAVDIPVVGIIGTGDHFRWAPDNNKKVIVLKGKKCRYITVEEVFAGIKGLLNK